MRILQELAAANHVLVQLRKHAHSVRRRLGVIGGLAVIIACAGSAAADTLDKVRKRGVLVCGITSHAPPFSMMDAAGVRTGFDIDNCKAVAAAVFGRISVEYIPLTPHTAFTSVIAGSVDMFAGGSTWTYTRDASLGLDFAGVYFYDGQGFLVHRALGINRIGDLDGATICVSQGTTSELNLADYFNAHGLRYKSVTFTDAERGIHAYQVHRCDAYTTDRSVLAMWLKGFQQPSEHLILNASISKEPFSPVVRQDDPRWRDIVVWALNVRIRAEELGVTHANVEAMRADSKHPEVQRLLGVTDNLGANLGLSAAWGYDIIRLVGNYHDVWFRYFGHLGVDRGVNGLWSQGGLLTGYPLR